MSYRLQWIRRFYLASLLGYYLTTLPASATPTYVAQVPLGIAPKDHDSWNLDEKPGVNTTGHWIFDTVGSFLQHWPNTRLRNGHNIVAATIPPGTLLYHGRRDDQIPKVPEWLATDPDHSYVFCVNGAGDGKGCWHLTLVTTRPLRLLYFDGSSAAKMFDGAMDSQNVVVWGGAYKNRTWDELGRIRDLCEWGKKYEIDGFVRMEMDFEIMACDFFSPGFEILSFLNLPSRNHNMFPIPTPDTFAFRVLEAGKWHERPPGEMRIQADYTRFISFYDTSLFPHIHSARIGKGRWEHDLEGVTSHEVQTLQDTLAEMLSGEWGRPQSGVDWKALITAVTDRYQERLELLQYILWNLTDTSQSSQELEAGLKQAERQLRGMLLPYITNELYPLNGRHNRSSEEPIGDIQWAAPTFKECATSHTRFLFTPAIFSKLTRSEKLILGAVKDVSKEICRVVVGMWAEGANFGLVDDINQRRPSTPDEKATRSLTKKDYKALVGRWRNKVDELMQWLDWSYWARCKPACGYEEMCYMPTWPFFLSPPPAPPHAPRRNISSDRSRAVEDLRAAFVPLASRVNSEADAADGPIEPGPLDDWYHPSPRCIRRLEPYSVE
ncbi:hypothetical protein BXZ70DRAFT_889319 [Cristinia sonorae]|uniref:Uncharacterized protein n=1 Tax=Cristinia sonorae TaxID=1940300 RepID=A0A8K0UUJ9_9AGAR|nr:hypothetical protein BXZ70DRAFT_889319 [Cristinia sonorae]